MYNIVNTHSNCTYSTWVMGHGPHMNVYRPRPGRGFWKSKSKSNSKSNSKSKAK